MQSRRSAILTLSLAAMLCAGGAMAQQEAPPPTTTPTTTSTSTPAPPENDVEARETRAAADAASPSRRIALEVSLRPWYTGPGGRFFLPGETRGGRDIDVEDLNIDSPRLSPAGRARLEVDEWSLTLSGAYFSTDRRTASPVSRPIGDIDIAEGDRLRTRLNYTTAELLVGNTFFRRDLYAFDYPRSRLGLELEGAAGARLDRFDITLDREAGGRAEADELFVMPMVGVEARLKPTARTGLSFATTSGWNPGLNDQHAFATDIIVRSSWQPVGGMEVLAGYRISIQRMRSGSGVGEFRFDGSQAGLFAGIRISF